MAAPAEPTPNTLRVACANCGRELRPKRELAGKRVRCPDCKSTVEVPALSEVKSPGSVKHPTSAARAAAPPSAAAPATHAPPSARRGAEPTRAKNDGEAKTSRPGEPAKKPKSAPKVDAFGDDFFESVLRGPAVAAQPASPTEQPASGTPGSQSAGPVPTPPERDPFAPPPPPPDRDAFELDIAPAAPITAVPSAYPRRPVEADEDGDGAKLPIAYHQAKEALKEKSRTVVALPKWTFFSGVFTFLFQPNVANHWLMLTGYVLLTLFPMFPAFSYGAIGLLIFGMIFTIVVISTISFAAGCLLPIVEQTAHGNDEIDFPQLSVSERVVPFGYLVFLAAVAMAIGWGFGWGFGLVLGPAIGSFVIVATAYLMFPFLLLSVLEAGSIWQPISGPVARSLVTQTRGWIVFHLLTGGMLALLGLITVGGLAISPVATAIIGAPLWAAWWLLYARLLGRLAWLSTQEQADQDE
jgi:hypothetical protein